MIYDVARAEREIAAELASRGLKIATNAMRPLGRLDFQKLVTIHDHEEHFLRTVFLESLVTAHRTRTSEGEGSADVTLQDIRTAMLMLGAAAAQAPEQRFSGPSKSIIKGVCPYCATVTATPPYSAGGAA